MAQTVFGVVETCLQKNKIEYYCVFKASSDCLLGALCILCCCVIYKSVKTNTEVRLPLYLLFEGKGIEVLNKYQDDLADFFKLRDNSNVNKELLIIAKLSGLNKRISFHTARHTNATLLIYSGVNITTVQKLLGHKSVKTTQVYTNIMDITIVRDLEKSKNNRKVSYM